MRPYKHTQIGWYLLGAYGLVILLICYLLLVSDFHWISLVGLGVMLVVAGLFHSLAVRVDDEWVKILFGFGVIKKNFRLKDIKSAVVVKNRWYYGWGIRYTVHGWLYNIQGLSAVELKMRNGKKYRIGTDDGGRLVEEIKLRICN